MEDSSTSTKSYGPRLWRPKFELFADALHDPAPRVREMDACDWELATEASDGFHVDLVPPELNQPMIVPPPRDAGRDSLSREVRTGLDNIDFLNRHRWSNAARVSYDATLRPLVTLDHRTPQCADGYDLGSEPESEDEPVSSCRGRFEDESYTEYEGIVECDSEYGESDSDAGEVTSECGSDAASSYLQLDSAGESEPDDFWGPPARVDSGAHDIDDSRPQLEGAASFFDKPHPWVCESGVPLPSPAPSAGNATSTTTPGALRALSQEATATDGALREDASTYITRAELDAFLELALPPVKLTCPVSDCATRVSHLRYLKRHLETHLAPAEREQHRCRRCGRNLARSDSLRRHLNMTQD